MEDSKGELEGRIRRRFPRSDCRWRGASIHHGRVLATHDPDRNKMEKIELVGA